MAGVITGSLGVLESVSGGGTEEGGDAQADEQEVGMIPAQVA